MRSNDEIAQNLEGFIGYRERIGNHHNVQLQRTVEAIKSLSINLHDFYTTNNGSLPLALQSAKMGKDAKMYLQRAIFGVELAKDEKK